MARSWLRGRCHSECPLGRWRNVEAAAAVAAAAAAAVLTTSAVAAPKSGNSGGNGGSGGANERERGDEVFGWRKKGGKRVDKVKRAKVHGPLLSGVQHAFARSYIVTSTSAAAHSLRNSRSRAADHEESAASYSVLTQGEAVRTQHTHRDGGLPTLPLMHSMAMVLMMQTSKAEGPLKIKSSQRVLV